MKRRLVWLLAFGLTVLLQSTLSMAIAYAKPLPAEASSTLHFLTEHSPPGQFLTEDGEVAGPTVELLRVLANNLQQDVQFSLLSWQGLMKWLCRAKTLCCLKRHAFRNGNSALNG